jgi:hypothetical protein
MKPKGSSLEVEEFISSKILGFHGGDYEEWRLLECYAL